MVRSSVRNGERVAAVKSERVRRRLERGTNWMISALMKILLEPSDRSDGMKKRGMIAQIRADQFGREPYSL
jgi:hypothetical protein